MYLSNFHDSFSGQWNSCITFNWQVLFLLRLEVKPRSCIWSIGESEPSLQSLPGFFSWISVREMRLCFFKRHETSSSSLDDHLPITTNVSLLIRHPGMYLWMYLFSPIRSIPPCFVLWIYLDNSVHLYFQPLRLPGIKYKSGRQTALQQLCHIPETGLYQTVGSNQRLNSTWMRLQ